jgi:hypothetical protein
MRIQILSRNYYNITCIYYSFFNSLPCLHRNTDKVRNYFPHEEQQLMLVCNNALCLTATSAIYTQGKNSGVFTHTCLIIL